MNGSNVLARGICLTSVRLIDQSTLYDNTGGYIELRKIINEDMTLI